MYNGFRFTGENEIEQITDTSFRILEQIGVQVAYPPLVEKMIQKEPHRLEQKNGRICVARSLAKENFFLPQTNEKMNKPRVEACAEIYEGKYLDPKDGIYKNWNEQRLIDYIKLSKELPHVGQASMLGCPIPEYDLNKQPLYEKYYTAKYGLSGKMGGYSVWNTSLCEPLYEMWSVLSKEYEKPIEEIFNGGVYMISPLQLGYTEGEHLIWFWERGLKMFVGCLCSTGMTAPVTPAGAIAMQLAELIFASILTEILYGEPSRHIWSSLSVADMRTMSFRYGRPEQVLMNNAMSDIADYYGMKYWGHGGLSDAKAPSFEAGVQKTAAALSHLMKGKNAYICAGLLSVDEVFSPTQMVLDNELTGYLKRIGTGFEVTEETLGLEALEECIEEAVPMLGTEHTVENMGQIWQPELFSRDMLSGWLKEDGSKDEQRARERALEIIEVTPEPESCISEACENALLQIIEHVEI